MRLFLPRKWVSDAPSVYETEHQQQQYAERREQAAIPDGISYQSKYDIAAKLVEEAAENGLDFGCVLGDSNFGKSTRLRRRLRELQIPYALEVAPSKLPMVDEETPLGKEPESGPSGPDETRWKVSDDAEIFSPEDLAQSLDDDEWEHIDWAEGTKKTLSGQFFRTRVRVVTDREKNEVGEETGWLLIEKMTDVEDEQESGMNLKAWICWELDDHPLEELVGWGHLRWPIERFHQDIKQHLGADEFQGRTWDGFHHHLAVMMLAHAFIAEQRMEAGLKREEFPPSEEVLRRIIREAAIQQLLKKLNFNHQTATDAAEEMLRGFTN